MLPTLFGLFFVSHAACWAARLATRVPSTVAS